MKTKQYKIWLVKVFDGSFGCEYNYVTVEAHLTESALDYAEAWGSVRGFRIAHVVVSELI